MRTAVTLLTMVLGLAVCHANPLAAQTSPAAAFLQIGGQADELVTDVAIAPDGAIVACGVFGDAVQFDPTNTDAPLAALGPADVFVACYEPDGALRWARQIGDRAFDRGNAIAVDDSGAIFVAGAFALRMDLDVAGRRVSKSAVGRRDAFIVKFSPSGEVESVITLGGSDDDEALDVAPDGAGGCFVAGYFTGPADLDTRPGSMRVDPRGGRDGFLLHLDAEGIYTWGQFIGGIGNDEAVGVAAIGDGGVVVSGGFSSSMAIDGQQAKWAGKQDVFIASFDRLGSAEWLQSMGGPGVDRAAPGGVTIAGGAQIAITGQFENRARFGDSILVSSGGTDAFVAMLGRDGRSVQGVALGGGRNDAGQAIAVDQADSLIVAGSFAGRADFEPGREKRELRATGRRPLAFLAIYDASLACRQAVSLDSRNTAEFDVKRPAVGIVTAAASAAGEIWVAGQFEDTVDFALNRAEGPIHEVTARAADGFIWKIPTLQP